jgi:hypothetical protein
MIFLLSRRKALQVILSNIFVRASGRVRIRVFGAGRYRDSDGSGLCGSGLRRDCAVTGVRLAGSVLLGSARARRSRARARAAPRECARARARVRASRLCVLVLARRSRARAHRGARVCPRPRARVKSSRLSVPVRALARARDRGRTRLAEARSCRSAPRSSQRRGDRRLGASAILSVFTAQHVHALLAFVALLVACRS